MRARRSCWFTVLMAAACGPPPNMQGVQEPSGVAFDRDGNVWVADDRAGVLRAEAGSWDFAVVFAVDTAAGFEDLEGISYDAQRDVMLVVSEASNRVFSFDPQSAEGGPRPGADTPDADLTLPLLQTDPHYGPEGIAVLAGGDSSPALLAVAYEKSPRAVLFLDLASGDEVGRHTLNDGELAQLTDLSDLTQCADGSVYALSDEGSALARIVVDRDALHVTEDRVFTLPLSHDVDKAEGVACSARNTLEIVTDASARHVLFHAK